MSARNGFRLPRAALRFFSIILCCGLASCTEPSASGPVRETATVTPSDRALLRLDEIKPIPEFSASASPMTTTAAADSSSADAHAERLLREGENRFRERLWEEAVGALKEAVQIQPQLTAAKILLGRAYLQLGELEAAEARLREVLATSPRDVAALQLLGEIAWLQNRSDEAIRSFRLALMAAGEQTSRPEIVLARLSLAQALQKAGYLTAAAEQFEGYLQAVSQLTPEMSRYYELSEVAPLYRGKAAGTLGDIYSQLNQLDKAAAAYQRAQSETPNDQTLRTRYLLALARSGRDREALDIVRKQLLDSPTASDGFDLLKQVCDAIDRPGLYEQEINDLAKQSKDATLRLRLVNVLLERGHRPEAVDILKRLVDEDAVGVDECYRLAELQSQAGDVAACFDLVAQTLRKHPQSGEKAKALVTSRENGADPKRFVEPAETSVKKSPDDAAGQYLLGVLRVAIGQFDSALEIFQAASKLEPKIGAISSEIALLYAKQKKWDEVLAAAKAATDQHLEEPGVYLAKGMAHAALDESEQADKAWMEAFRLAPRNALPLYEMAKDAERRGQRERCEQLYRRILDEVDPRFMDARERLVRLYLFTNQLQLAKQYFSDFEVLKQSGAPAERCKAFLEIVTSNAASRENRREAFQKSLQQIIQSYPNDAVTYRDMAVSYLDLNEYDKALDWTDRGLKLDGDDFSLRELKATLNMKLLEFDKAAEVYRGLLKDRPRELGYWQKLLELAESEGDHDASVALLRELLLREDLHEKRPIFTSQLISALLLAKHMDEAVDLAKKWLEEAPEEDIRRRKYLITLREAGKHDEGVALALKYFKAAPDNTDERSQLIDQLKGAKRYTEAQQWVLQWLASEPEDLALNGELISLCLLKKQWDDAIDIARTGAELPEYRQQYESWLGQSLVLARRFDKAIEFYQERANQHGDEINYRALIAVMMDAGRYREAERIAHKVLAPQMALHDAKKPYDLQLIVQMRYFLSQIYQDTDRLKRAIDELEEIYKLVPDDPRINNNLGYTMADAGMDIDRAEKLIRFSMGEDPRSHDTLDSLGWVLYKRGRFEEAAKYLQRSLRLAEEKDPVVLNHMGDTLYRLGKKEEAKDYWQQAKEHSVPDSEGSTNREHKEIQRNASLKLNQLAQGEPVTTAEIVELKTPEGSTTQSSTKN